MTSTEIQRAISSEGRNEPWASTLVSGKAEEEGDLEKKEGKNRVAPLAMSRHAGSTSLDSQRRCPLSAWLAAGRAYGVVSGFRANGFRSFPPAPLPSLPPYNSGVVPESPSISLSLSLDTIGCCSLPRNGARFLTAHFFFLIYFL